MSVGDAPCGDYNDAMERGSSLACAGAAALAWLGLALAGCDAEAKQCSNPCEVGDGDVCVSVWPVGELGRSLPMFVGRQSGTCGGLKPVPGDGLVLIWSRDPAGPFTPVPVRRYGDGVTTTPDRAGAYFFEAAARDGVGAPDRLVVMIVDPKTEPVSLRLLPSKGLAASATAVKVRWVPPAGADRFPRRRWPVWLDNDRAGKAGRPLRLPPGRYDVEWTHVARGKVQTGITTIDVTGAGSVDVPLTVASAPARSSPSLASSPSQPCRPAQSSPSQR